MTLFSDDAVWEMPPYTGWYQSPEAIGTLVSNQCPAKRAGDLKLVTTTANGQAAFGMYLRGADQYDAFQLQVVDLGSDGIDHVVAFFDLTLFAKFGLPDTLPLTDA